MHSIYKNYEIQKFFAPKRSSEVLSGEREHVRDYYKYEPKGSGKIGHDSPMPNFVNGKSHEWSKIGTVEVDPVTKTKIIRMKEMEFRGALHDIYTIPKFKTEEDIINFMMNFEGITGMNEMRKQNYKDTIERQIVLAFHRARQYLDDEDYFVSKSIKSADITSLRKFLLFHEHEITKTSVQHKISYCTLLKEMVSFLRIIQYSKFNIDWETGNIDTRNKKFIYSIIEIFDDKKNSEGYFSYPGNKSTKFSTDSDYMNGQAMIDGQVFPISWWFNVKSVESIVEKMDSQESYDTIEAFKDLHRMKIEVEDSQEAMRIAKVLYKKLGGDMTLSQRDGFVSKKDAEDYYANYCVEDQEFGKKLIAASQKSSKKITSEAGGELKLTRPEKHGQAGFEVQIIPRNNNMDHGYKHHDVYRIRRKIVAKIRRHWYIKEDGIKEIIKKIFAENAAKNKWKDNIGVTKENVFNHIMTKPNFLVKVYVDNGHNSNATVAFMTEELIAKQFTNDPDTFNGITIQGTISDIKKRVNNTF